MTDTTIPSPARAYEDFYGPAIFAPAAEILLEYADPRPGESVLDLACGTGQVARRVAPRVGVQGQVTALDLSPGMLAVGRDLPPPEGAAIEWRQGDAVDPGLEDGRYDLALCQHGLQFFGDRARALREVHRVLRPGGRVVLSVWQGTDRHPAYRELAELEARHLGSLGVTEEDTLLPFSVSEEEVGALLREAGFQGVRLEPRSLEARFPGPVDFIRNMELAYAAVIPAFVEDPRAFDAFVETVEREAAGLVARYVRDGMVVVPMHLWVGVGWV